MVKQWRPKSQLLWSMDSIMWPTWLNRFATFDHNIQLVHSLTIRSGFLVPGFSKGLASGFPFLVLCFCNNQGASWEGFGCPWAGKGTTSRYCPWCRPHWACCLASSPVPQDGSSICHCEGQVTTWCSKLDKSFPFDFAYCSIYQRGKMLMQDLMVLWSMAKRVVQNSRVYTLTAASLSNAADRAQQNCNSTVFDLSKEWRQTWLFQDSGGC